jgi:hypothetical protein
MKNNSFIIALIGIVSSSVFFTSCSKEDNSIANPNLTLNVSGLEDLGANFKYEGWIMVDGSPISTGTFTVNASGVMSQTLFPVSTTSLNAATKFFVSIEPYPDTNPTMSSTRILAGSFSNKTATLDVSDVDAISNALTQSTGKYILTTPSDGANTNEKSGLWFQKSLGTPLPNLSLPTPGLLLPPVITFNGAAVNWKYEGWVVLNGKTLSTGKFNGVLSGLGGIAVSDDFNGYSGSIATPSFPGEDFLKNAPTGLTFPIDLSGSKVFVTIEPNPDYSPNPSSLKILSATVPTSATAATVYSMDNTISTNAPKGTAVR